MSSSLRFGGLALRLEELRDRAEGQMLTRLFKRRERGSCALSDEEIQAVAKIAGVLAKQAAAELAAELRRPERKS